MDGTDQTRAAVKPKPTNTPQRPTPGADRLASTLVRTARTALGITAAELAAAAGCDEELVDDIESGRLDPTLDTVGRLVSSVGLEVRAGPGPQPDPRYLDVDPQETQRLSKAFVKACEFAEQLGVKAPGPPTGTQPEWDGSDPAPAHLFGAGPTRRDGGGWSALVVRDERARVNMDQAELGRALGLTEEEVAMIEAGEVKLPVGGLQVVLAAMGATLVARLEVYDAHDDGLHLQALADPERYQRRLEYGEKAFAKAAELG